MRQNSRKALEEDAYKWSTEDMWIERKQKWFRNSVAKYSSSFFLLRLYNFFFAENDERPPVREQIVCNGDNLTCAQPNKYKYYRSYKLSIIRHILFLYIVQKKYFAEIVSCVQCPCFWITRAVISFGASSSAKVPVLLIQRLQILPGKIVLADVPLSEGKKPTRRFLGDWKKKRRK